MKSSTEKKITGGACIFQGIFLIVFLTCWIVNFVKFTKCDFKEPYKYEIIHGVGLLGPAAIVTVWWGNEPATVKEIPDVKE